MVHETIQYAKDYKAENLVREMDVRARQVLSDNSILFYFWHKRFEEIALFIEDYFKDKDKLNIYKEIAGNVMIAGRNVRARADMVLCDRVVDIKTGTAPNKKQLTEGMMPQLPLEGYILQSGGFPIKESNVALTPILQFLQLKNGNPELIEYKDEVAQEMIDNTVQKVRELFGQYSTDKVAEYEYRESVGAKYHEFDDLARVSD